MMYVSTRGGSPHATFTEVVRAGLASDGGLYVPEKIYKFSRTEIRSMRDAPYCDVALKVLTYFGPDIPTSEWDTLLRQVYRSEVFGHHHYKSEGTDLIPVQAVDGIFLADLCGGPTLAFKDWALTLLGALFARLESGRRFTILGATSGDTGSAAIEALRGKGIPVVMLSPAHGMSEFQKGQMYGVDDPNICNIAIDGSFDDCQRIVKELNNDRRFKAQYGIGAVNSINWARIAAQVVYYFYVYSKMWDAHHGNEIDVVVPTGNFGNAYAGLVARRLGLPIGRVTIATNANDVLPQFFKTGIYQPRSETVTTISPSMDITAASNFERFIFDLLEGDGAVVRELYERQKRSGRFMVQQSLVRNAQHVVAHAVDEASCIAMIRYTYDQTRVCIDPHTAIALHVAREYRRPNTVTVALETAQPCKFDETLKKALGRPAPRPKGFDDIESRARYFTKLPPEAILVKQVIEDFYGHTHATA